MATEFEPGLFPNVAYEEYEAMEGLRKSRLFTMHECTPLKYKWELDHPDESDSPALKDGRRLHTAILEPTLFEVMYVREPAPPDGEKWDKRKKIHKAAWLEFAKSQAGKIIISDSDCDQCLAISESVRKHPFAGALLKTGLPEMTLRWRDKHTGLRLKGRLDLWIPQPGIFVDLKFMRCAAPRAFGQAAAKYGYYFQMAMYYDGVREVTGQDIRLPILIAVEKEPPYDLCCYEMSEDDLAIGRDTYKTILMDVQACIKQDRWQGYDQGLNPLMMPEWIGSAFRSYTPLHSEQDDDSQATL